MSEWGNYFQDLMTFPDQIFLVRPEYDNSSPETMISNASEEYEYLSDCSEVEYMIEDKLLQMSLTDEGKTLDNNNNNMIEISIETNE